MMDRKQVDIYVEEREMKREKKIDVSRDARSSRRRRTARLAIGWAALAIG